MVYFVCKRWIEAVFRYVSQFVRGWQKLVSEGWDWATARVLCKMGGCYGAHALYFNRNSVAFWRLTTVMSSKLLQNNYCCQLGDISVAIPLHNRHLLGDFFRHHNLNYEKTTVCITSLRSVKVVLLRDSKGKHTIRKHVEYTDFTCESVDCIHLSMHTGIPQ